MSLWLTCQLRTNQTKPKIGEKKKQRRIKDDEIDNLVQLNRDKFQSSTLNYLTKPNQNKWVSFWYFHFIWLMFYLILLLFWILIDWKLNWFSGLKVNFAFQTYQSTVTIHQLIIWLSNQSNMSFMNLDLIYLKQTIVSLKGSVWFWFLVWDFEFKNWFNDW